MVRSPEQEGARPGATNTETGHELRAGAHSQSTDFAARARRHDYAVRVVSERADGVLVTQLMTDLPAAERKRRRTHERGLRCELHLVRITPVGLTPLPMVPTVEHLAELLGVST